MASRPRKPVNRDLPDNLYRQVKGGRVYYRYKNPITGKRIGLGTDRAAAIRDAQHANSIIAQRIASARAKQLLDAAGHIYWHAALDAYLARQRERLAEGEIKPSTLDAYQTACKALRSINDRHLCDVATRHLAGLIRDLRASGKRRMAQAVRTRARDVFRWAIAEGYLKENPAEVLEVVTTQVQRERLTVADWRQMYAHIDKLQPWERNGILLALVTGRRRGDVCRMRFRDVQDGYLNVIEEKTGHRLRLSLELGVEGHTIGSVIKGCRDNVVSEWIVHHHQRAGRTRPGDPVRPMSLSAAFRRLRDLAKVGGDSPPPYHELRSLSGRLYTEQGVDILRHKSEAMAAKYREARNTWEVVG